MSCRSVTPRQAPLAPCHRTLRAVSPPATAPGQSGPCSCSRAMSWARGDAFSVGGSGPSNCLCIFQRCLLFDSRFVFLRGNLTDFLTKNLTLGVMWHNIGGHMIIEITLNDSVAWLESFGGDTGDTARASTVQYVNSLLRFGFCLPQHVEAPCLWELKRGPKLQASFWILPLEN